MKGPPLLVTVLVVLAPAARAQDRPTFVLSGTGEFVWVRSDTLGGAVRLRGPVLAGEGRVGLHGVALAVRLLEGRLQSLDATAARDLIEARVSVAAQPVPWLEVSAGPVVRAYVTDSVTERWVLWQARARMEAPIVAGRVSSYVELWHTLASRMSLAPQAGRVQGGEAGLVLRPPRGRLSLRIAYRVDAAVVRAGASETLEAVSLGLGLSVP